MLLNSSSSSSPFFIPSSLNPSNDSFDYLPYYCFNFKISIFIAAAFTATKTALLLPLCVLVIHICNQRRRQHRPSSHSDVFSYHMMFVELISVLGWSLFCCGTSMDLPLVVNPAYYIMFVSFPGQMFFHCLTCLERYMAVVYPVTYMSLRNSRGVLVRNISIGVVWILCIGWKSILTLYYPLLPSTPLFCLVFFSVVVVSFCSLSVFCVLIRPGPGEGDGKKERVDQSKQRAVFTIMAILAVLLLYFLGFILCIAVRVAKILSYKDACFATVCAIWFSLPSSLLLPLLFLHRAGKLTFCCSNTETRAA